jgi:two-component system CheB/CheR fusion protein
MSPDSQAPAEIQRSPLAFPVVGIGASAGGVTALQRFFEQMPDKTGMAFVVVVHLSPTHESTLDKILQNITRMPVSQVTDAASIEADHIYVIPPSKGLAMCDGHLRLTDPARVDGRSVAIDLFFRSLAEAHRERAFCVVLSGSGCDGAQGLGRIKELGGVTLVQSPVDAEFDSMPRSAIATGMVDIVLPASELAHKLNELWHNARHIELPDPPAGFKAAEAPNDSLVPARDALHSIMALLRERTGHDFSLYKRSTVLRRIERRMQVNMLATLPQYLAFLQADSGETLALLQDMLISVTQFFRDRDAFDALERALVALHATRQPQEPVRAWIAGCATGEEAYSITMLLCSQFGQGADAPPIQVFASDIDQRAINTARQGMYPESIITDVPPARLRQYFTKEAGGYRIGRPVRDKVTFSTHNVLRDPPFTKVDLICCRNLMIYMERAAQTQLLQTFHFALKPGGLLMLGNAETADAAESLFEPVDKKQRLFRAHAMNRPRHVELLRPIVAMTPALGVPQVMRATRPPLEDLHRRMQAQYAAPSVLIDAEQNIVHVDQRAAHLLVSFDELDATLATVGSAPDGEPDPLVLALEAELQRAQSELSDRTEQSATTTEDLRASNEELQAVNEELRSTTEELETSAEELQSVNEELITVNNELRTGLDETAKLNDDLRNLISSTDMAIVFLDRLLRIKRFTPRAAQLFNLIDGDVGRPLLDITHRLDYAQLASDLAKTLNSLQHVEREVLSGNDTWYLARLLPYRTAEDRIDGVALNFIDITARHEAEDRLHAAQRHMHVVAQSMQDYAIMTLGTDGLVNSWNAGAEQLFGYTAQEMMGRTLDVLFTPEDSAAGMPRQELEQARKSGHCDDDRWMLRKGGSRFFASGGMTKLRDHLVEGFVKIARDLTDNKVLETRRKAQLDAETALREKLEEASTMKDEFLAVMSHELKNPLNLIQLNAELLLRSPEARRVQSITRSAETIRRAVASQVQIIDDLLDLSRLNTGKLSLSRGPVDLRAVVERIASAVADDAASKGLEIRLHLQGDPLVHADAVRVEQIAWNLVNNALKFTPRGGTVDIGTSSDPAEARLVVADTGVGIEPDIIDGVFEMFRQVDGSAARKQTGLGVGLALVKRLTDLHGGRLHATSAGLGKGATFTVWLPLHDPALGSWAPATMSGTLESLNVLLVDDDTDSLEAFGHLMRMSGADVTTVSSVDAALASVAGTDYDLIVSDIAMPGGDGHALVRKLRESPRTRNVIAVAVSGRATAADRASALRAGFDAHLGKPVDLDMLIEQVRQLIGKRDED